MDPASVHVAANSLVDGRLGGRVGDDLLIEGVGGADRCGAGID